MKKLIKKILFHYNYRIGRIQEGIISGFDLFHDLQVLVKIKNPVCFDIGANKGQTIEKFRSAFTNPTIYSFEPSTKTFEALSQNCSYPNIHLFNIALGEEDSEKVFYNYENDELSSLLELEISDENYFKDTKVSRTETVTVKTLDTFAKENTIQKIDILKVDTQGYDLNVLKGAKNLLQSGMVTCVFLELNFITIYRGQGNPYDVSHYLKQFNIHLVDYYEKVRVRSRRSLSWCSALYCRREPGEQVTTPK